MHLRALFSRQMLGAWLIELRSEEEEMPKLFVKAAAESAVFDLRVGMNRIGRGPDNHFQIHEPSVSSYHCELMLGAEAIIVTDLGSSNGTFIDGVLVREGFLFPGQNLRLGRVEMYVEARLQLSHLGLTPWHRMNAAREVSGPNCFRHAETAAAFYCPHCDKQLCHACSHPFRWAEGLKLHICRACGCECAPVAAPRMLTPREIAPESPVGEAIRRNLIPHLAAWLKQKFLQVLMQQRAGLIETQEVATRQMLLFEQRLAKVQKQMEQRIRAYETRINGLEHELASAEEKNRHLIRAQIESERYQFEEESKLLIAE